MVATLMLALPTITTAGLDAQPLTMGEWMRILFVTPDRELDASQKGVAIAPPPLPAPQVQTSSDPAPPKEPVNRAAQSPRLWFRGGGLRTGRRRRRQR
jgi:hypothetical protein